jgi:hypothetical protein
VHMEIEFQGHARRFSGAFRERNLPARIPKGRFKSIL